MMLYYDDSDNTRPHCFPQARDAQAARYIADIDETSTAD